MSGRTIPAAVTEVPGNFITSAMWNTQITNGVYSFTFNEPYFKGVATTGQSIPASSTFTTLTLTQAITDTEGGWSSGAPTLYTVQTPGRYLVIGRVCIPGSSGTDNTPRSIQINQNGVAFSSVYQASGGATWTGVVTGMSYFQAGDTISFNAMQQSSGTQTTSVANVQARTQLEAIWMGNS